MFISKFSAFNFRSLKQISLRIDAGRNVIVGKNNSGKSNIIKGIEILIGEKFPTYQNITANDFYTYEEVDTETGELREVIADNFYLEVELSGRDFDEGLIQTIKKSTAFSKVRSLGDLYYKNEEGEVLINYDLFQSLDELDQRDEIEVLANNRKTAWKSASELLAFLKASTRIKLFFCKSRVNDEKIGYGILCFGSQNDIWISHFMSKKLRDSLTTSTVISALRSHKEDLRLVHYTWFGRLIIGLWQKYKILVHPTHNRTYEELIKDKSIDIKHFVDAVFEKDTSQIRKLLEGAIAHKSVSFKFINDTGNELYKNVQLFVNDGIDRPLHEKGTGIQSAIIISLFSLYCNNFHNKSSLLIAEEPELFLHPQARRVISAELDKFLSNSQNQERQLIISTHSTEYLRNVDPVNIIRVYKDSLLNCSIARQLNEETSGQITKEIKRFIWSKNTELFFADKVILVEGGEEYIVPSLVDNIVGSNQYLDYKNVSVIRVNGKGSFLTYMKMLDCFAIEYMMLGDLDCFKDVVPKVVNYLNLSHLVEIAGDVQQALNSMTVSFESIDERVKDISKNTDAQQLRNVFNKFRYGTIGSDDDELQNILTMMEQRYTKGDKHQILIEKVGEEKFKYLLDELKKKRIFIWSHGELENYYTQKSQNISARSKDMKALEISYLLVAEPNVGELFTNLDEIADLVEMILRDS